MSINLPLTYPLPVTTREEALIIQDRLVRAASSAFSGQFQFQFQSDYGVAPPLGRPSTTARVEAVLAETFGAEAAALVQGAGTGAIRSALGAGPWAENMRDIIIHDAPVYSTTQVTFEWGKVNPVVVDFNNSQALVDLLESKDHPNWLYVQHTRQQLDDSYDPLNICEIATERGVRVICDENYAVMRTPEIAVERGAAASAFSLFKLHGPAGIGAVLGHKDIIDEIHRQNYSGGTQVQGDQALSALQQLITAPLLWAQQSQEVLHAAELISKLNEVAEVRVANAQDLCLIVRLNNPIAHDVCATAATLGAAAFPVGSNSVYEFLPLFYRMSSSVLRSRPDLADYAIRINPMRASAEHVVDILTQSIKKQH
ncbi:aminotransferase class I/II-fold pyridoxal phosphate-dependent enzyme [Boudabousia marimammalium]|uniref:Uncharacterized protein n=1 Tax=Boudabousia marimammalium TaxID=156892 RepID=A0A1Q5PSJ2_9ACTO|nr:aminotransferase class I/II-fold pyridoxal phosphate-dependent enzyme [Boudabousia marimammalium]OKL50479.1 hypothetical protein BM477_00445 [Boudabousia marimammalium]